MQLKKKEKFLNLDFVYVLPYCELSFYDRDHCRISNYHILSARLISGLRFKKNVPCGRSNHGFINISEPFSSIWRHVRRGRFRWVSIKFFNFFCQNRLIQVWKSMLKQKTHPEQYSSSHLKVDFCIQLLVKFQILINFL